MLRSDPPQTLQISSRRQQSSRHSPQPAPRSPQAICPGCKANAAFNRSQIVIRQRQRMLRRLLRNPSRSRNPQRSHPRPSLHQHRVRVPVITPLELHHELPPRKPSRQPNRRHAGLSPRADKPHLLHRRQHWRTSSARSASPACDAPKLALRPAASRIASTAGAKRMPQDHRPPRPEHIHIPVPIHVPQISTLRPRHKRRIPPTARNARTGESTPPGR